jgi:hypothetical protein
MLNSSNLAPTAAITAVVLFGMYRRVRRNIGRQTLTVARPVLAMVLFTFLCVALAIAQPLEPRAVAYLASGLLVGAAIGWFALRHTAFEATAEGYFYTPHLYIGIAITALFIGRMLYRVVMMTNAGSISGGATQTPDSNPLTLGILFLTGSYYIVYCTGLLRWLRRARQDASARLSQGAPQGASSTSV